MLANYEALISDLRDIQSSILSSKKSISNETQNNPEPEQIFFETPSGRLLQARLSDTMSKIFQHEPESRRVIEDVLTSVSPKEAVALIDDVLETPPAVSNFIQNDPDKLYLQQLVDISVIKSKVFRWTLKAIVILAVVALTLLGFGTERTLTYAETARQIVQNAQDEFDTQVIRIKNAKDLADSVVANANKTKIEMEKEQRKVDGTLRMLRDENSGQLLAIRQLKGDFEQQKNEMKILLASLKNEQEVWLTKLNTYQKSLNIQRATIKSVVDKKILENSITVANSTKDALEDIKKNRDKINTKVKQELLTINGQNKLVTNAEKKLSETMGKIKTLSGELDSDNGKVSKVLSLTQASLIDLEGKMSLLKLKINNEVMLLDQINDKRDNASEALRKMLEERPNVSLAKHWEILETNAQVQIYLGVNILLIFYIWLRGYLFRKKTLKDSIETTSV